jgi:hypothetical protein
MTALEKYISQGFLFVKRTNAPHHFNWNVGDLVFCNSILTQTPRESLFEVVGILRKGNDLSSLLVMKRILNLTTRPGYCNTFHCPEPTFWSMGG